MPGTFSPTPTSKETTIKRSRHASRHVRPARAVMHVGIANPRGKHFRHSQRMHNPQFYVSGKMPMETILALLGICAGKTRVTRIHPAHLIRNFAV